VKKRKITDFSNLKFEPFDNYGSAHSSYTKNGCLILVFQRGKNKPIKN